MNSISDSSVIIPTSSQSVPSAPPWWGELVILAHHLRQQGILVCLTEGIHFARRRFGRYEVIDFLAVLFGYALSGERTLETFYTWVIPLAPVFMALFGRDHLPSRSALSRFLSSLSWTATAALRSLFLTDLLARPLVPERQTGGLLDRCSASLLVFDIDGTRAAARQRAIPQTAELPPAFRRLEAVCAAGSTGRKRGEVVRTRTVISQAHAHQWLGSFGNRGNGHYREELRRAVEAIGCYLAAPQLPQARALLRLDGQDGTGAVLKEVAGFAVVTRGKDYPVLDQPQVQARLHLAPDQSFSRPESPLIRCLYDCPEVPVGPEKVPCRGVVASHPAGKTKSRIGVTRQGVVYELFFTTLPRASVHGLGCGGPLVSHRGAFEPALADDDQELDPDRWCSHAAAGQEAWQIVSQWLWNLRLELGHVLEPGSPRITEFAPAVSESQAGQAPAQGYGPPVVGGSWKTGRFAGAAFALQPDGTVHCPAGKSLLACERRREAKGSLRIVYAARIADCRCCPLREQCQWQGHQTQKPRQMSILLHPLGVGTAPLLWRDWSRRVHRRAWRDLLRHQCSEVSLAAPTTVPSALAPAPLSRAQRAHYRLSAAERLARNARAASAGQVSLKLFGVPAPFAAFLGLSAA